MSFDFLKRRDQDLHDELQSHLRMAAQERMERGVPADEAHASARREMGNEGLIKEVTRSTWGVAWLERVIQDLRFGWRTLRKEHQKSPVLKIPSSSGWLCSATLA